MSDDIRPPLEVPFGMGRVMLCSRCGTSVAGNKVGIIDLSPLAEPVKVGELIPGDLGGPTEVRLMFSSVESLDVLALQLSRVRGLMTGEGPAHE